MSNERQPPNLKYELDPCEDTSGEIARGAVGVLAAVKPSKAFLIWLALRDKHQSA